MNEGLVKELRSLEKDNGIVLVAITKKEVENGSDRTISDKQWELLRKAFQKTYSLEFSPFMLLVSLARDLPEESTETE